VKASKNEIDVVLEYLAVRQLFWCPPTPRKLALFWSSNDSMQNKETPFMNLRFDFTSDLFILLYPNDSYSRKDSFISAYQDHTVNGDSANSACVLMCQIS